MTPRGSDVFVSARYGPRFEHATHAVRVGGEAPVAVAIPLRGLTAGRTRQVRLIAWSAYGVQHSVPVRLTTTDRVAPAITALAVRGRRGQRVRLRFRPADGSAAGRRVRRGARRRARG